MLTPNLLILYVENPIVSADFYGRLLGRKASVCFPTYAAFEFENGFNLGLWSKSARDFKSGGQGHLSEWSLMVEDDDQVRSLHNRWGEMGIEIEQPLHEAVFGLTFVALDPDGHRIRVCTPDD